MEKNIAQFVIILFSTATLFFFFTPVIRRDRCVLPTLSLISLSILSFLLLREFLSSDEAGNEIERARG